MQNCPQTTPHHILTHKSGCPSCNSYKNESIVYNILKENNIKIERLKYLKSIIETDRVLVVDFYLPEHQIIIEYNGEQHYKPVCFGSMTEQQAEEKFEKQKSRDAYLQQMCNKNYINLIWIDGRQFINSKLIKHINNNILPILKINNNE